MLLHLCPSNLIHLLMQTITPIIVIAFDPVRDWSRQDLLALIGIFLAAIAVLLSIAAILASLWGWTWRSWRAESRIRDDFGADLYPAEVIKNATRYYVRPDASSIDLVQELEAGINIVATREDLFKAVERFIDEESLHHHMLLLADSGMGKSSFVLNYYAHNQRRLRQRYKLAVIPLGNANALDMINKIDHSTRKEVILFLDAFDEDLAAVKNYWQRLDSIMQACGGFRRVLITCRTQFFPKDSAIPQLAMMIVGPRSGPAHYTFWHLYIAPFSDAQVDQYLRLRFGAWPSRAKKKARTLVKKVPKLTIRPLLLSYITDLLETEEPVRSTWDIYKVLISKWYEREKGFWEEPRNLEIFSEEVAVQLYLGFLQHGYDRVERVVITNIVANSLSSIKEIDEWKATSRSLLHRDAKGNWKFAHRSIMEFLFLKKYFEGDERCRGREWTDQMKKFVLERDADGKFLILSLGSLRGADLSGADLTGTDFRGLDLSGINLSNADLCGAMLRDAVLKDINLSGTRLNSVDLSGQDLSGANLTKADLSYSNLDGADLSNANLHQAVLRDVSLKGTNLIGADLRDIDFSHIEPGLATLSMANLSDCSLEGKDFRGTNLSQADLSRAKLHGTDFSGADLSNAKLGGAELKEARLGSATLSGAIFQRANLTLADLYLANLIKTNLDWATLFGANLSRATLVGANLHYTNLRDANLSETNLNGAKLNEADLRGADLRGADFSEATLSGAKFNETALRYVKNIDEVELSKAVIYKDTMPGRDAA